MPTSFRWSMPTRSCFYWTTYYVKNSLVVLRVLYTGIHIRPTDEWGLKSMAQYDSDPFNRWIIFVITRLENLLVNCYFPTIRIHCICRKLGKNVRSFPHRFFTHEPLTKLYCFCRPRNFVKNGIEKKKILVLVLVSTLCSLIRSYLHKNFCRLIL